MTQSIKESLQKTFQNPLSENEISDKEIRAIAESIMCKNPDQYGKDITEKILVFLDNILEDEKKASSESQNIINSYKKELSGFKSDDRDPLRYAGTLILDWLIESAIASKITKESGLEVVLSGCDKNRDFLENPDSHPDLKIQGQDCEIKSDFTGFGERKYYMDVKESCIESPYMKDSMFIFFDATAWKYALIDIHNPKERWLGNPTENQYMGDKVTISVHFDYEEEFTDLDGLCEKIVSHIKENKREMAHV